MFRLKAAYRGERAAVIFGGPSLLARRFDFARLRDRGFVTFVEAKALTPRLLDSDLVPDYYLMPFAEKAKDNGLQNFIFRSFLAQRRIDPLLKPSARAVARDMRARLDEYFEDWRPERGAHKRYRYRPGVFLKDSPYELLARVPHARVIVNRAGLAEEFPAFAYGDRAFYFSQGAPEPHFDIDSYFNPIEQDGMPVVRCAHLFSNSAAIALYPLLRYMGFREVFFLGMDMSILGSLEYSAPYVFRTMAHYWWFLHRNEHVFNAGQPHLKHGWLLSRPKVEFQAIQSLWAHAPLTFTHVYQPWRWAWPVPGVRTMSYDEFYRA